MSDHRDHMTDGRWHDDCPACLRRRERGGTGVNDPADDEPAPDTGAES